MSETPNDKNYAPLQHDMLTKQDSSSSEIESIIIQIKGTDEFLYY